MNISLIDNTRVVTYKEEVIELTTTAQSFNKSFSVPALTGEDRYSLRVSLFYHGVLDFEESDVFVQGYSLITETKQEYANILGKRVEVVLKNVGTIPGLVNYSLPLLGADRYLLFNTNGILSAGNLLGNYFLESQETILLFYEVSFLPLLFVAIVIVALVLFLFRMLKRIEVTKNVVDYSADQLGITMKVEIKLKNLGRGSIRDLKIYDPLTKISHEIADYGTITGKKVRKGIREFIYWNIEEIKPNEEIILFYEFRIKIGIIGRMSLNPTDVYYTSVGREFLARSNSVVIQVTPSEE